MANVTMKQLLQAGVHYGHRACNWNPKMAKYIFGKHNKVHIINLEQTLPSLRDAMNAVGRIASNKGKVLFVGTKHAARDAMREEATRAGMPYVNYRWLGGTLTNWKTMRQSIRRLKDLEQMTKDGSFEKMSKKEALMVTRELEKLERSLGGIKNMGGLPDALFVIDVSNENIAVTEARRLGIPVIAVVDTNSDPDNIDMIIPGNDDAIRSIRLYAAALADAIVEAKESMVKSGAMVAEETYVEDEEKVKAAAKKKTAVNKPAAKAEPKVKAEVKAEPKAKAAPKKAAGDSAEQSEQQQQ